MDTKHDAPFIPKQRFFFYDSWRKVNLKKGNALFRKRKDKIMCKEWISTYMHEKKKKNTHARLQTQDKQRRVNILTNETQGDL